MDQRRVDQLILWTRVRVRLQRIAEGLATSLIPCTLFALGALVLHKTGWISADDLWTTLGATTIFPLIGLVWAFWSRIDLSSLAMQIDEANGLKARLTTAWCFLQIPPDQRTPFQQAAIAESLPHLTRVRIAPAAPFALPASALPLLIAVLAVTGVVLVRPPTARGTLPAPEEPQAIEAVFNNDDLKIAREQWEEVKEELKATDNPDLEKLDARMEQLFQDLEERKLTKEQFLTEVDEIKDEFFKESDQEPEWKQIVDETSKVEDELAKDPLTQDLAEALKAGDMEKAADELEKLSQKLAEGKISDKELDRLTKHLENLAKQFENDSEALDKLLKDKEAELEKLRKQLEEKAKDLSDEDKKRLSRLERDLKELRKKAEQYDKSGKGKTLKKLSRAMKEGADMAQKAKKTGKGASKDKAEQEQARKQFENAMKSAAGEARDVEKKKGESKAKDKAERSIDKMKERLRRQADSKDQKANQQRDSFDQRASGEKEQDPGQQGKEGKEGKEGEQGDQKGAKEGDGPELQVAQGKEGGQEGNKEGEGDGKTAKAGGEGDGPPKAGAPKEGDGKSGQAPAQPKGHLLGDGQGTGEGSKALGTETGIDDKKFVDSKVEGRRGEGPSTSEVVESASQSGFASTPYREAYEYEKRVAEEVLEEEQIPPGYRFYVERYFEVIRPREAAGEGASSGEAAP